MPIKNIYVIQLDASTKIEFYIYIVDERPAVVYTVYDKQEIIDDGIMSINDVEDAIKTLQSLLTEMEIKNER